MARSLVYPAVWDSVKTRLLTPLHRAGYDISVFTVLSAGDRVSASRHKEELFSDVKVDEINQYVQPTASINAQEEEGTLINKACILKPNWYLMKHQDSLERWAGQWKKVEQCYQLIEQAERARGESFSYLVRLRSDSIFLYQDVVPGEVFRANTLVVPRGITNRNILNDHLSFCARSTCAAYFSAYADYSKCNGSFSEVYAYSMGDDAGNTLLKNRLKKHGVVPVRMPIQYTLMRRCNMTAVDIVKRGNNGLVCKRFCDTFPSRTCMAKCDALGKKICAESSELQRRPDAGLSMFRADAAGKHVKWQVNPRKDAFFTLVAYPPPEYQVAGGRETAVPAHGGYEPRMPGTLNWSVGLQICSIRKATAPAIYPVYVLAANANAHERELYTTLGARVIDLTKDNRTVQSWQPQTFWKPTFSPGKHLPQLRRDGWLTYFKFTVFRFQSWVRRGIFLDADVAVLSSKIVELFDLPVDGGFAAESVHRTFPYHRTGWQSSTFAFRPAPEILASLLNASFDQSYPAFTNTEQDVFDGVFTNHTTALNIQLGEAAFNALKLHHHVNRDGTSVPAHFPPHAFDETSPECARFWQQSGIRAQGKIASGSSQVSTSR